MTYYPKPKDFTPEPHFPDDHTRYAGKKRCTAWNKNQGRQCRNLAMVNNTKCRTHGGKSLSGKDHPNAKDLRYSKHIHLSLSSLYQQYYDDPNRLELDDELSVNTARMALALSNLDAAANRDILNNIIKLGLEAKTALREQNGEVVWMLLTEIVSISQKAKEAKIAEEEVDKLTNQRLNITSTIVKNQEKQQQMLAVNVVMRMMMNQAHDFREILLRYLDPDAARPILIDIGEASRKHLLGSGS